MQEQLKRLGLSDLESQAYLAVVRNPRTGAAQVAEAIGISRTSVYPALNALVNRGLLEGGAGYGARFRPVPPERAFPELLEHQRAELLEREKVAKELVESLTPILEATDLSGAEPVEILRDRRVVNHRFERLQLEAESEIAVLVKAPMIAAGGRGNPVQTTAMERGVKVRSIYDRQILADPEIGPFLSEWVAQGEETRVHPGELPCKFALFDRRVALMPLLNANSEESLNTVLLRNAALGAGLGVLFDVLWERSEPLAENSR